jgi:putative tryptophan/tyrosine transport system substrate-binding protein
VFAMRRRDFISGAMAASWPLATHAQQLAIPVIGFLSARSADESAHLLEAFRRGLVESGSIDGENATIEYRWAAGQYDRLPALAADLARRRVAVLVAAGGDVAARAAAGATKTVPIVAAFGVDPVNTGLVAGLSRPGGNVTGVSNLSATLESKRLGLLRELVPQAATIGLLMNPHNPTIASQHRDIEDAARAIGLRVLVERASTDRQLRAAFDAMMQSRISALLVVADAFFSGSRSELVQLAALHGVPTMYYFRDFPMVGGLMSYGIDLADTYRQMGVYAGRILKGAIPSALPIVQPTKFEFIINLKAAKALSLVIPAGILSIADEVIE